MTDPTLRQRFGDKAAYDILKLLLIGGISALVTGAVSGAVSAIVSLDPAVRILLGVGSFTVVAFVAYEFIYFLDRDRPWYRRLRSDWTVVEKSVTYVYLSHTDMQYFKQIRLKARRANLDRYFDKYNWSGSGRLTISSEISEHTVETKGRRNIWHLYEVDFHRHLKKNEEVLVHVRWDLSDTLGTAVPFFSQTIQEPTKKLVLALRLPSDFRVSNVTRTVLPNIESLTPVSEELAPVEHGATTWSVKNPRLLHCYEVRWSDPDIPARDPVAAIDAPAPAVAQSNG